MVALLLMMEIFNFTTMIEKNEFQKFELQKNFIKDKDKGSIYSGAYSAKNSKLKSQDPKK